MIITKIVTKSWNPKNKNYFIDKGYSFTKMFDKIKVKVNDLPNSDKSIVDCECNQCYKHFIAKYYRVYNNCLYQQCKTKITYQKKYGTDHPMKNKQFKKKFDKCIKDKYGVENVFQLDCVKEKITKTLINKYGVEHPLQNKNILEKEKQTNQKKYGVDFIMQNSEMFNKSKSTCKKHYNVDSPLKNKDILNKQRNTIKNGSKYQKLICQWTNGLFDYKFYQYKLDIALLETKTDIEYDGGGHDLEIQLKGSNLHEFKIKENERNTFLNKHRWNVIRIVSKHDRYINKNDLLSLIHILINKNIKLSIINIDNETVEFNNKTFSFNDVLFKGDNNV